SGEIRWSVPRISSAGCGEDLGFNPVRTVAAANPRAASNSWGGFHASHSLACPALGDLVGIRRAHSCGGGIGERFGPPSYPSSGGLCRDLLRPVLAAWRRVVLRSGRR